MRRAAWASVLLAIVLALPAAASARTIHTRIVDVVSGPEIAARLIGQVSGVSISSTGATVTLDAEGRSRPVHVDYGALASELERDPQGAGLLRLAAIPLLGGAFLRFLVFLARLGSRS